MTRIRSRYGQPAVYNSTGITLSDGDSAGLQVDSSGYLLTTSATGFAGEDTSNDVLKVEQRFGYSNITTATTSLLRSGVGVLHSIVVGTTAAGTITIYDNTVASGTKIGTLKSSIVEGTYVFDCAYTVGLTIVTAAASDITVNYR